MFQNNAFCFKFQNNWFWSFENDEFKFEFWIFKKDEFEFEFRILKNDEFEFWIFKNNKFEFWIYESNEFEFEFDFKFKIQKIFEFPLTLVQGLINLITISQNINTISI